MQIKHFDTLPEDAVFIRKEVFVKEQGFKNEFDEKDNEAHFLVRYENGSPVATCRIFMIRQKYLYLWKNCCFKALPRHGTGVFTFNRSTVLCDCKNAAKSAFLHRCAPQAFMKRWALSVRVKNTLRKTARIFIWKNAVIFTLSLYQYDALQLPLPE